MNLVLVEPEIPPNTGNIARLCAAMNTTLHLVEPLGFELSDRTLKRAGMDYWQEVRWQTWPSWEKLVEVNPHARFWFCTTKTSRSYTEVVYQPDDWLVLGRETRGLPEPLLHANPERCITIPMRNPQARSLNLSTAAAIVLMEALRVTSSGSSVSRKSMDGCSSNSRSTQISDSSLKPSCFEPQDI